MSRNVAFAVKVWPLDLAWVRRCQRDKLRLQLHQRCSPSLYAADPRLRVNFQMKNAIIPSNAIPPATDSPMTDPVPSPELSSLLCPSEVGVGDEEELALEATTVTTTTVGKPSDPVLWMLLMCTDGGAV